MGKTGWIVAIIVIVLLLVGGWYFMNKKAQTTDTDNGVSGGSGGTNDLTGVSEFDNAITEDTDDVSLSGDVLP